LLIVKRTQGFDISSKQLYSSRTPSDKCKVLNPPLLYLVNSWRVWDDRFKVLALYSPKFSWKHLERPKIFTV
jgi:hypothetical protein